MACPGRVDSTRQRVRHDRRPATTSDRRLVRMYAFMLPETVVSLRVLQEMVPDYPYPVFRCSGRPRVSRATDLCVQCKSAVNTARAATADRSYYSYYSVLKSLIIDIDLRRGDT